MKLLVVGPVPPPFHGQSYMLAMMLAHLGGDRRRRAATGAPACEIDVYHVNSPFSRRLGELGRFSLRKFPLALRYLVEVLWCRYRYGAAALYYVPATGLRSQVCRDWFLFGLSRLFCRRTILHWHGLGLKELLEARGSRFERAMTRLALGRADLSIVLAPQYAEEVLWLAPHRVAVVPNGIPDPCPDYAETIKPEREARAGHFRDALSASRPATIEPTSPLTFRVLFLGHCTKEKGLFDSLEAVALANARLRQAAIPAEIRLLVAGEFVKAAERKRFDERVRAADLRDCAGRESCVRFCGFVFGAEKDRLLRESDCLCFPSYFPTEAHPVTLIEGLAYGLPVIVSRWRALPSFVPDEAEIVDVMSPGQISRALLQVMGKASSDAMRAHFLAHYEAGRSMDLLTLALSSALGTGDSA